MNFPIIPLVNVRTETNLKFSNSKSKVDFLSKPGRGTRPSTGLSTYSSLRCLSFTRQPCGHRSSSHGRAGDKWSEKPGSPSSHGVAWHTDWLAQWRNHLENGKAAVWLTGSWCSGWVSGLCLWGGRAEFRTLVHRDLLVQCNIKWWKLSQRSPSQR